AHERGARLLRPRRRPPVSRRAQHRARRAAGRGHRAAPRHVLHGRADDQSRPPAREGALRRLDRSDARPLALRPVRAHRRGDRGQRRDLHAVAARARPAAPLWSSARVAPRGADDGPMPGRDKTTTSPADKAAAHYHGQRRRLRQRFLAAGSEAISDYEMLELILFRAIPQRDVKPLAKDLLATFGSFSEVIAAPLERLKEVDGLGEAAIAELKIVQAAANRLVRGEVKQRQVLSSWPNGLDYCRTATAS